MSGSSRSVRQHFVDGAGPKLFVATIGFGEAPVVLLHGIGSSGMSWLPVITNLATDFRLVIPDLRGHSQSGHPESGYLLENYADDLERLIVSSAITRPILIGHSLGGLVAVTWARRHPNGARAIVLEDMPLSGGPDQAPRLDQWAQLAAMTPAEVVEYYRQQFPEWSESDRARRAAIITSTHQAVFSEMRTHALSTDGIDYLAGLSAIQSPIVLLYGDQECGGLVSQDGAERFVTIGPNFSAIWIPGASHSIHREATQPFLKATRAFLADTLGLG